MIEQWIEAKAKLDHYKKLELNLRMQVLEEAFPSTSAGAVRKEVGPYLVKGGFANRAAIDELALDRVWDTLSDEEMSCVKYKPTFIMAKFKQLTPTERARLEEAITIKPAMPTLKIVLVEEE